MGLQEDLYHQGDSQEDLRQDGFRQAASMVCSSYLSSGAASAALAIEAAHAGVAALKQHGKRLGSPHGRCGVDKT